MNDREGPMEGPQDYGNQMVRLGRSTSADANDRQYNSASHHADKHFHSYQHHNSAPNHQYAYRGIPPSYPPSHHPHPPVRRHAPQGYPYSPQHRGGPPQNRLPSVVTTSFSIDDEREDVAGPRGYYSHHPRAHIPDDRHPVEHMDDREITNRDSFGSGNREAPPVFDARAPLNTKHSIAVRIPPSPADTAHSPPSMPESSPKVTPDALKRSFWHHSRPADSALQSMHPAFAPPKRAKVGNARKEQEVVITPRTPREIDALNRNNSWGAPDEDQHRQYRLSSSYPAPWEGPPPNPRHPSSFGGYPESVGEPRYGRSWSADESVGNRGGAFHSVSLPPRPPPPSSYYNGAIPPQGGYPSARQWSRAESYDWTPSPNDHWHQNRDDIESRDLRSRSYSRDTSWDDRDARHVSFEHRPYRYYDGPTPHHKVTPSGPIIDGPSHTSMKVDEEEAEKSAVSDGPLQLLAQPEDRISLSETLCTIRENIEVFTATKADVEAPAPGRKHPVVVGQVGLRCIHCRHTTKSSDRVKRAVCYPSSIKRIYRTVIDMKLDHFAHCRFVPSILKGRLEELKAINTRSTGTTMQYFVRAAAKMGMVDAASGVRLAEPNQEGTVSAPNSPERPHDVKVLSSETPNSPPVNCVDSPMRSPSDVSDTSPHAEKYIFRNNSDSSEFSLAMASDSSALLEDEPSQVFMGKTTLALVEDKMALSPLRCFLRENVYAFAATEEDIAVRTPTTFSVVVGQVGIGCVHCHSLPAKERSNRAVCFPFAINRIYQSVADIQRFHLGECKMVPLEIREKFQSLQSASSKGSKGLATRQYWVSSARKVGLIDTSKGIRFVRDPSVPTTQAVSLDILAQVASNVTTVDRPLVLPEDMPLIAEFLYVVMEQLQACRFTEADRNKRRLKDVGCIGVECKHCAGQVESRKFFWSSVNAVESNFVSVHTHMMECKMLPPELKEKLSQLKQLRKEQTAKLKTGSQKAFFQRVWTRLHGVVQQQMEGLEENPAEEDRQPMDVVPVLESSEIPSKEERESYQMSIMGVESEIEKMTVISM